MGIRVAERWSALTLLVFLLTQTPCEAQKIDLSKLGPQVGQRVPNFSLRDQAGNVQTLQSVMGPKGGMLVFFRSADW